MLWIRNDIFRILIQLRLFRNRNRIRPPIIFSTSLFLPGSGSEKNNSESRKKFGIRIHNSVKKFLQLLCCPSSGFFFYLFFLFRRPHFSVVVSSFLIWTLYILYCSSYSQCKNMLLFPALTKHLVSMTTTVRHGCWYFFNITLGLVVTFKNIYNHQGSKRHFWETA